MKHLLQQINKYAPHAFLVLGALGFLDASYLSILHYNGIGAQCFLVEGCDQVLGSPYATIAGIPTALFGVLYYAAIFILAFLYFENRSTRLLSFVAYGTAVGFLVSLGLLYLQAFVLHAFCFYCLVSALISTLLFSLGTFVIYYKGRIVSQASNI